jgi:hypothetical protein
MLADGDEAVRRFAAENYVTPAPPFSGGSHASFVATSTAATHP